MKNVLPVSRERIARRIEALTALTEPGRPYTRRAFTDIYQEARSWLAEEFRDAGLEPRIDAGANLIGSRPGSGNGLPAVALGSHIDTVSDGGRFDGIAGVITALEAAQALQEGGVELDHPLWVIDFLSEEPSDYGASCVGSRALVGTLTPAMLEATNPAGEALGDALRRMGGSPGNLSGPLVAPGAIAAFLELHIEQGPVLESAGKPIGIVEGIVGIKRLSGTVIGKAGHAGTTPMKLRKDALVGASRAVERIWDKARDWAKEDPFVATVGRFDVLPNGANVVPGRVEMTIEARALEDDRIGRFLTEVTEEISQEVRELGVEFRSAHLSDAAAVRCSELVQGAFERACQVRGHKFERMSSGAGHDAMQVGNIAPVGMIFVPCKEGISHNPAEEANLEDLVAGAEVLLEAVLQLDRS